MIYCHVLGGLGNQMFQYAACRALSLRLSEPLRLDVSGFTDYSLHQGFELPRVFTCNPEIATEQEIRDLLGWRASRLARKILVRPSLAMLHGTRLVVEPHFHYWPGIWKTSHNVYLTGYWQSEKYFLSHAAVIRAEFTFKSQLASRNAQLAEQISRVNAVSLHVRRGDYANNPKTTATHGLCSMDYYRAAIRHVAERVDRPNFIVFSDDIPWARENLAIAHPCVYVDHNHGVESYNDMRLMSLCRHHIIANSSFSWWGAWLNTRSDKIVVAPKKWFVQKIDVSDLLPADWTAI